MRRSTFGSLLVLILLAGCFGDRPAVENGHAEPTRFATLESEPVMYHRAGAVVNASEFPEGLPTLGIHTVVEQGREANIGALRVDSSGTAYYLRPKFSFSSNPDDTPLSMWRSKDEGRGWDRMQLPPYVGSGPTTSWRFHLDGATDRLFMSGYDWAGHDTCGRFTWSDDGGQTWLLAPACHPPISTGHIVLSGPPREIAHPVYPSVLYSCGSPAWDACAHSFDGGAAWTVGAPVTGQGCTARPSHVARADGVVYAMAACDEGLFVLSSRDHALTWASARVGEPAERYGTPLAITSDQAGNVYALAAVPGRPLELFVSRDQGASWTPPAELQAPGASLISGLAAVAGAPGRLAVSYWGANSSTLSWRLYVAFVPDALSPEPVVATVQLGNEAGPARQGTCNVGCHTQATSDPTDAHLWLQYLEQCQRACPANGGSIGPGAQNWSGVAVETSGAFLRGPLTKPADNETASTSTPARARVTR